MQLREFAKLPIKFCQAGEIQTAFQFSRIPGKQLIGCQSCAAGQPDAFHSPVATLRAK
jgi:hypothetical protein